MHRLSHNRYDVEAWMNASDDIELKVYDHRVRECIAHAVLKDPTDIVEGGYYLSLFVEDQQSIRRGTGEKVTIKKFADIDRNNVDQDGSTLYWNLNDEGYHWARHPLSSWQSMIGSGEFYEVEFVFGEENLDTIFEKLREEYMNNAEQELVRS